MVTSTAPEVSPNEKGDFSGGRLRPYHDRVEDYVGVFFGQLPKIVIAWVVWWISVDLQAASHGWDFSPGGWVMNVFLRDLFLMLAVAGTWDYILYFSPLKEKMNAYKFNKKYPSVAQFKRDVFWTTSATLLASVQEVMLYRWWCGGNFKKALFSAVPEDETSVPWDQTFFGDSHSAVFSLEVPFCSTFHLHKYTLGFIIWTVTMLYWRILHFYVIHRGMHPWFPKGHKLYKTNWDIGNFLYRHVHSHHHKSYNPTAFSGINMLPCESMLYISAALIPILFRSGCHPWIHLYTKLDLIIGAQIGHDGFDAPGGGSYFHQLHHAHFECNYGDSAFPMDWLFGTFCDGLEFNNNQIASTSTDAKNQE